jgi:hypothetical protein
MPKSSKKSQVSTEDVATSEVTQESVNPPAVETTVETKEKGVSKRSFTVLRVTREGNTEEFEGGNFQSVTPAGAARKAANKACKTLYGKEEHCSIEIVIKEVTKNHPSKEYTYRATRTKDTKDVPFKGNTGDVQKIPFNFSMNLKALKKDVKGNVVAEKEVDPETETITDATV